MLVSILSSYADEIWYECVMPRTMCCLSSWPSCDLEIPYTLVFIVLYATFNNISVISCWSMFMVGESGASWENHRPVARHWQIVSHNIVSSTPHNVSGDRHWLWLVIHITTIRSRARCPLISYLIMTFNLKVK